MGKKNKNKPELDITPAKPEIVEEKSDNFIISIVFIFVAIFLILFIITFFNKCEEKKQIKRVSENVEVFGDNIKDTFSEEVEKPYNFKDYKKYCEDIEYDRYYTYTDFQYLYDNYLSKYEIDYDYSFEYFSIDAGEKRLFLQESVNGTYYISVRDDSIFDGAMIYILFNTEEDYIKFNEYMSEIYYNYKYGINKEVKIENIL